MVTFSVFTRSVAHHCTRKSKPHNLSQLLFLHKLNPDNDPSCRHHYPQDQSRRTLILDYESSESVKLRRLPNSDSGIVEVNLDRPAAKNAIGNEMLRGLRHTFEMISGDDSANVVLISSSVPKFFCAGADLKWLIFILDSHAFDWIGRSARQWRHLKFIFFVNSLRSTFSFIKALRIPTIAVIEGAALGGGLEMALSCDLRICGEDAIFGLPETGLAIIPGAGGTQRLPRLVGKSVAKKLIFTGQKISGREAMIMGVADYCVPTGEAHSKALEIAQEINQKGPMAIRMAKKAIDEGLDLDLATALELEEECYEQLLNTKDRLEGLAAFAEKRKPRYTGQ